MVSSESEHSCSTKNCSSIIYDMHSNSAVRSMCWSSTINLFSKVFLCGGCLGFFLLPFPFSFLARFALLCFLKHLVFHLQWPFDTQLSQSATSSIACENTQSAPARHFPLCSRNRHGLLIEAFALASAKLPIKTTIVKRSVMWWMPQNCVKNLLKS